VVTNLGTEEIDTYKIRAYSGSDPALEPYKHLIYSNFMRSLRDGNPWFRAIDSRAFNNVYRLVISLLLARADTVVRLAVLSDDEDVCMGFSIMENDVLHYVFVKPLFSRQGIGKSLVPRPFNTVTHLTEIGRDIRMKNYRKTKFNPFI
jgi:hypothetical protein